jgi:ERCC4-type nuclease
VAKKLPTPEIWVDVYEKDNQLTAALREMDGIHVRLKSADTVPGYTPTGDYVIVDRAGREWGIERKAFTDCVSSIRSKRVYGQLAQLIEKYGERAVLMVEESAFIPKKLARTEEERQLLKQSVNTFANEQSSVLMVWRVGGPNEAARFMAKWAKTAHRRETSGRGIRVILDGNL